MLWVYMQDLELARILGMVDPFSVHGATKVIPVNCKGAILAWPLLRGI